MLLQISCVHALAQELHVRSADDLHVYFYKKLRICTSTESFLTFSHFEYSEFLMSFKGFIRIFMFTRAEASGVWEAEHPPPPGDHLLEILLSSPNFRYFND